MDNYNIIGYAIYLPITFFITIVVGRICYTHGEIYLLGIINDHPDTVRFINKLLLVGYYLVNLGFAAITLSFWPLLTNFEILIGTIGYKLGQITMLLGVLHFNNMAVTYVISKRINKQHIHI